MFKKRATILLFCFLAIFSLGITSFVYIYTSPGRQFNAITDSLLEESLKDNFLMHHFLISKPNEKISSSSTIMPIYSVENEALTLSQMQTAYEKLLALDFSEKESTLEALRDSLCFYLSHNLKLAEYAYFEEPFTPYSGIQNELPILLTEYTFEEKDDVENYLEILNAIPAYLEGLCQFEEEKAENGKFMSDTAADTVIASLNHFCTLEEAENPFLSTFEARLETLLNEGKISQEEYTYYLDENLRLITTVFLPSYEKTGDTLTLLKSGNGSLGQGLCSYENGKQYYEILVSTLLGEDIHIPALKNAFSRQLMADFAELNRLLESNPTYFVEKMSASDNSDPLISLSPEECMKFLQNTITKDFIPANPEHYPYLLKNVTPSMEKYTNPAYYFTPPIDDSTQNIIYINRSQTPEGLSLFTTLAHEGFPGHLYQSVTSANALKKSGYPTLAGIAYFGGFTEGYATYVEFLSYEYAKEAALEVNEKEDIELYYDYLAYNRRICLCLYSILDIMIHYENAKIAEIRPYLYRIGITSDADIQSIYDYIVAEPGTYITYYGGYLKILECRHLAMEYWGEDFSNKRFHALLLEQGPQDFETIRKRIKNVK